MPGRVLATRSQQGLESSAQSGAKEPGRPVDVARADRQQHVARLGAAGEVVGTRLDGRHPGAEKVIITIEVYDVPTMEDYRKGERSRWVQVFPDAGEPDQVFTR